MPRDWTTQLVTSYSVEIKKGSYILHGIIFYIILVHLIHISQPFRDTHLNQLYHSSNFRSDYICNIGSITNWQHKLLAHVNYHRQI